MMVDSAEAAELAPGLKRGAIGVTTNPDLSSAALKTDRTLWSSEIDRVLGATCLPNKKPKR
jgi:hypothetical protein